MEFIIRLQTIVGLLFAASAQDLVLHQNDAYVSGGVLQPGTWEESECITTCAEDDTCFAVDYVTNDRLCWFHSGNTICDAVQYAKGVKHIQLARCVKNAHIAGGLHQRSIGTFQDCLSRCKTRHLCMGVDYNPLRDECWFHHEATIECPYRIHRREGITHIQMSKCQNEDVRSLDLPFVKAPEDRTYETFLHRHAYNGVLQSGVSSWLECINLCVGSCTAVDFDQSRGDTCWHHTEDSSCQELSHKRGCTHYRIKACIISAGNAPFLTASSRPSQASNLIAVDSGYEYAVANSFIDNIYQCGKPKVSPIGSRIMGGTETVPHSWPWMVALHHEAASRPRCAGSLISESWVLTTAHCLDQDPTPSKWQLYIGSHDLKATDKEPTFEMHGVRRIIIHHKFDLNTFDNDIALIELLTPVRLSASVSTVCLPPDGAPLRHGRRCIITGWGNPPGSRRPLKQATVPLVGLSTCRRPDWLGKEFILSDRMICAGEELGGVDTCQGDSGGPLQCYEGDRWVQVGVTSFGRGCALPKRPGVYTNVAKFKRWIRQYTYVT